MGTWYPRVPHLLAGALSFLCLTSTAGAQGGRLYGMIDIDAGFGQDIAFSVELGGAHTVRYFTWGRDLDEVEGMAIDGDGELYLFAETGVVKKVRLAQPEARPVTVAQLNGLDLTSATSRPADALIELFDARGGQFITFDPRTDAYLNAPRWSTRREAPQLNGLARTATRLYATAEGRERLDLYACTEAGCERVCAGRVNVTRDVQAIERLTDGTLLLARTSITPALQVVLHVETLDPAACRVSPLATVQLDREQVRGFLKPGLDLDRVLRQARRLNRAPQIEAIAIQR
jgi:hypothetical protein